jgi:hypothetical protein
VRSRAPVDADPLLEASRDVSPLPAEAPNVDALDDFLVRMRKARF